MSLLDDLGGWPVLNPEWDESGFDYIDLMAKLKLYGTSVLLSQWVGVDDRNSSNHVIHVNIKSILFTVSCPIAYIDISQKINYGMY